MASNDASDELMQLRAELAIVREQALVAEAEAAKVWAINADLRARNAHLELMNEQMRREKYGARSERSRRLLDQLELTFEELEANASEAELLGQIAAAKTTTVQAFTRKRSTRRDFPAELPREKGHHPRAGTVPMLRLGRSEPPSCGGHRNARADPGPPQGDPDRAREGLLSPVREDQPATGALPRHPARHVWA